MLYAFFWVIPWRMNFICGCFGTLSLFHLHRRVGMTYLPMKMEQTEFSETSSYKIWMLGNYPEESIQHSEHGESLKSRISDLVSNRGSPVTSSLPEHKFRQVGHTYPPMTLEQSVPKCQHTKFRRWGITRKKAYN
jgi:hypothetical protein